MTFPIDPALASQFDGRLRVAVEIALAAGQVTLGYFQQANYEVQRKRDRSPVTNADLEAEKLIRSRLAELYPHDAILGEELGSQTGDSEYQWIIDPIDGTKSFISGVPLYSTLVGVTHRDQCVIGVIAIPALNEIVFAAKGHGAWYSQQGKAPVRAKVSQRDDLADSLFVLSQVDSFAGRGAMDNYKALEQSAYITRSWGDGYGYLLVATGRAELMVDPIVNPWDVAAILPVILEAGGRCTDWNGVESYRSGNLVATNGVLHNSVLELLKVNNTPKA
jgi:histidinol-phosphatase